ncbi:unnamed protein product [Parascedosporium putredinis]|uniref:Uncharacterized protein n=1 Tax=Parascedosporium putredinis TaxID=1442378 RepID=A0A9P1HCD1_9PEZI|nr:unnamed protein product [Parascedosporium putredinis]CAI8004746.1 unnamed protein product [Parascedosporium putredinis]
MAPQDTFIDDEDDSWLPLCIEEFDLSDRNFRPCPCGYQEAEFRANITKNQRKRAQEQRQKEAQKREAEKENRKNLVGVRVVQKNLVYVTGLTPTVREDELTKTLRKPEFFGQYGNIQKSRYRTEKVERDRILRSASTSPLKSQKRQIAASGQLTDPRTESALYELNLVPPTISASLPATTEEAVIDSPAPEPAKPVPAQQVKESKASKEPEAPPTAQSATTKPGSIPEDVLKNIIKKLYSWQLPNITAEISQSVELYPPLFDIRGGEKRRAMREEEARLGGEQEETVETQEPSEEGEPEAGGSLALGGEPEEREPVREGQGYDLRRALAQNSSVGSIGSRTMTPQQQAYMRPQSAFTEHLPPGISAAQSLTSLMQQQGHSRQSSRFSFANESASNAATIQIAANPRIMAQQKAMMPTSFPSQQGSQYYTSSHVRARPIFWRVTFGAAPKDTNSDLLQSIIRGRAAGSAQAHDAAKREYMNSPFSNQYPSSTSSTPAPASGLLASLYGNQPGAFQDFVDLADPSILQARMQHQSQSNAGVGQGLFGGQSQGHQIRQAIIVFLKPPFTDDELPSLDEASTSVDALVADDDETGITSRQLTPARFNRLFFHLSLSHPKPSYRPSNLYGPVHGIPQPAVPITPTMAAATVFGHGPQSVAAGPIAGPKQDGLKKGTPGAEAKRKVRALALDSGLSKDIASQASPSKGNRILQEEDFPALDAHKPGAQQSAPQPIVKPQVPTPKPVVVTPKKAPQQELSGSPAKIEPTMPKTLRLVSTPRTEGVPGLAAGTTAPGLLSMVGRAVRPGTPTSEIISDSASIVSASVPASRSNSPPPSKIIGSAHLRTTTKSQQRKQRKEAHKGMTEVIVEAAKPEAEEHAPVLGRKKKQKKEKLSKASRKVDEPIAEPKNDSEEAKDSTAKNKKVSTTAKDIVKPTAPQPRPPAPRAHRRRRKPVPVQAEIVRPEPEKPFEKLEPTPDLIFRELVREGVKPDTLSLLKPVNGHALRAEASAIASKSGGNIGSMHDPKLFSKDFVSSHEEIVLLAGKPIRRVENGQRVLITPFGDVVRSLSEEEEERYLLLQDRVAQHVNDPVAFKDDKHRAPTGDFSIIEGRMSYNTKIRREEAIAFANQFAMPSMRLGNRTLSGSKWRDEVEDPNTAEVMNRLKAMFYDQKSADNHKPRASPLFQGDVGTDKPSDAAPEVEQVKSASEGKAVAKPKETQPTSRENLFADQVDENPINDELLPRFLGPGGRDNSPPKPAPPESRGARKGFCGI